VYLAYRTQTISYSLYITLLQGTTLIQRCSSHRVVFSSVTGDACLAQKCSTSHLVSNSDKKDHHDVFGQQILPLRNHQSL